MTKSDQNLTQMQTNTSPLMPPQPSLQKKPGRVAAGKKMSERNRLACEAKKQAAATTPSQNIVAQQQSPPPPSEEATNIRGFYILSIGGFIISLLRLYYKHKEAMAVIERLQYTVVQQQPPPSPWPEEDIKKIQRANLKEPTSGMWIKNI